VDTPIYLSSIQQHSSKCYFLTKCYTKLYTQSHRPPLWRNSNAACAEHYQYVSKTQKQYASLGEGRVGSRNVRRLHDQQQEKKSISIYIPSPQRKRGKEPLHSHPLHYLIPMNDKAPLSPICDYWVFLSSASVVSFSDFLSFLKALTPLTITLYSQYRTTSTDEYTSMLNH